MRGSPSLVGRGIANPQEFLAYLKWQKKLNAKQIMCYAQRYHKVLETGDASVIVSLSSGALRRHAMEALTAYAKYTGSYDSWQQVIKRYSLKWTDGNESLKSLERFFNPDLSFDSMLARIREMIRVLPEHMGNIIKFNCLTGLRPSEAIESVRLLNLYMYPDTAYYNPDRQALEHYKFKQFIRTTKKAFISYITLDNLQQIGVLGAKTPSWNAIRKACRHRNIAMDMSYCRKLFASWLRQSGIQPEIIDLLQGRVSQSILTRHYLAPSQNMKDDVLQALEKLQQQL